MCANSSLYPIEKLTRRQHNSYHAGQSTTLAEIFRTVPEAVAKWRAHCQAEGITVGSCPSAGPFTYAKRYEASTELIDHDIDFGPQLFCGDRYLCYSCSDCLYTFSGDIDPQHEWVDLKTIIVSINVARVCVWYSRLMLDIVIVSRHQYANVSLITISVQGLCHVEVSGHVWQLEPV